MVKQDSSRQKPESANKWRISHPQAFDRNLPEIRLATLLILGLIGWLDYITGYEFGFFIFYFIPVAIASWYGGRMPGLVNAIASAVCWYLSDLYTYHHYSKAYFVYWETFMRLASFITTALSVSRIRDLVLNEERMLAELQEVRTRLEELQANAWQQTAVPALKDEEYERG